MQGKETPQLNVIVKNCSLGSARFERTGNISVLNSRIIDDHCLGMKIVKSTVSFKNLTTERCSSSNTLITLSESDGSISNCTFVNNQAQAIILASEKSSLMIENSNILTNTLSPNSGAIVIKDSYSQIKNTLFESNTGRGLLVKDGAILHATDLTFTNNSAAFGGAILGMTLVKMTLLNSTFTSNTAGYSGSSAHKKGSELKLSTHVPMFMKYLFPTNDMKLSDWFESYGGAIVCVYFSRLKISNCTFTLNHAANAGGAVVVGRDSEGAIKNSTFYNNSAQYCGALYIYWDSTGILGNLIFKENNAKTVAGAVAVVRNCSVRIINNQFLGNKGKLAGGLLVQDKVHIVINKSAFINNTSLLQNGAGGGILQLNDTTVRIKDSVFHNNSALGIGGGLAVTAHSSANLSNVTFYRNGGKCIVALMVKSSVTVTECSFIQNVAAICSLETGTLNVSHSRFIRNSPMGAILATLTTMTLLNVTFEENQAYTAGAAISFEKFVNVTMKDCVFRNNTALKGGALWVYQYAFISIDNCGFMGNKAEKKVGGAIAIGASARLNMTLCTLEDNTSGTDAGAIYISGGSDAVMFNCTLKGNSAGVGGGAVGLYNSNLSLYDAILQNNSACMGNGGGILAQDNCIIKISNSLLTNNTSVINGGAIYATNKMKLSVHNGTFFSNNAESGAIMIDSSSTMVLKDSKNLITIMLIYRVEHWLFMEIQLQ